MHKPELSTKGGRTTIMLIVGSTQLVIAIITLTADLDETLRNLILSLLLMAGIATGAVLNRHETRSRRKR